MFGTARQLARIADVLEAVLERATMASQLKAEVDELRLTVDAKVAQAAALVQQAESRYRVARGAEERARRFARAADDAEDDDEGEFESAGGGAAYGGGGPGAALHAVRNGLEDVEAANAYEDPEEQARRLKWQRR